MTNRGFLKKAAAFTKTLAFRIMISFALVASVVNIVMGVVTYRNAIRIVREDQQTYAFRLMDATQSYVEIFAKNIQNMVMTMTEQSFLRQLDASDGMIASELNNVAQTNVEYVDAIHFIRMNESFISTDSIRMQLVDHPLKLDAVQNALIPGAGVYWSKPYLTVQNDVNISCARAVMGPDGKTAGVLIIDTNFDKLNSTLKNISGGTSGDFILMDNTGLIVSTVQKRAERLGLSDISTSDYLETGIAQEIQRYSQGVIDYQRSDKGRMLIYYSDIPRLGWEMVCTVDYHVFEEKVRTVQGTFLYFSVAFILLIFLLSSVFAWFVSRPIQRLTRQMNRVKGGDLSVRAALNGPGEIGMLGQTFNDMLDRIQILLRQTAENERAKKESDFKMLQAQINPHFLYNTLSSVNCMASMNRNEDIQKLISALINLLQASVSKMDEIVTLEQEIETLKNYVIIQQLRYGDKFTVSYHLDTWLMKFRTLKMILQPLVENSIFHGIQPKDGPGHIRIVSEFRESKILLIVEDNGVGMSPDKMLALTCEDGSPDHQGFSGMGVTNVHQRIRLYFGDEYGIQMMPAEGGGCRTEITLPVRI